GIAAHEDHWRAALEEIAPLDVPLARSSAAAADWQKHSLSLPKGLTREDAILRIARFAALSAGAEGDLAYRNAALSKLADAAPGHVAPWVPLRSNNVLHGLEMADEKCGFATDIGLRL